MEYACLRIHLGVSVYLVNIILFIVITSIFHYFYNFILQF